MLKLSEPQYFSNARRGYVRGAETVRHMLKISQLYKACTGSISGAGVDEHLPPLK